MRKRIYLRIAKGGRRSVHRVVASTKPIHEPLYSTTYPTKNYLPTVIVALDLEIPDEEFNASRILLEAKIKESTPAVEIKQAGIEVTEEDSK